MKKKGTILRVVAFSLGVLLAPILIQYLPNFTYTIPIAAGLLVGAIAFVVLLYFGSGLSREYIRKNSRWIWGPFALITVLIIASFLSSFFKLKLPKEAIMSYYVFAVPAVAINIFLNIKKAFPAFRHRRKKSNQPIEEEDLDIE